MHLFSTDNCILYDENKNPVFLQKAVQILEKGDNLQQIMAVHFDFNSILQRSSSRTLKIYAKRVFEQLTDISKNKLYDEQFKSLAYFLKFCPSFIDCVIDKFKSIPIETLRLYILYGLNLLAEIEEFDKKVEIHLKFAEMLVSSDIKLEGIVSNHAIEFVEKGMQLIQKLN